MTGRGGVKYIVKNHPEGRSKLYALPASASWEAARGQSVGYDTSRLTTGVEGVRERAIGRVGMGKPCEERRSAET